MDNEITDEKIRYWYKNLPETVTVSKITQQQRDFIKNYMSPDSDTYGDKKHSALKAGCAYGIPPRVTKYKVDKVMQAQRKNKLGYLPIAVDKPQLVDLSKGVLYKALTQDEDMHLAQDTAKFVLKSTKEFAEKQDMTSDGMSINGLNISFASFRKPEEIEEAEVVKPKPIEAESKIRVKKGKEEE